MSVDKSQFSDSLAFQAAEARQLYAGEVQVDLKVADMCQQDIVRGLGANCSGSVGVCALSEVCTYSNDKIYGPTGICLKASVGVAEANQ